MKKENRSQSRELTNRHFNIAVLLFLAVFGGLSCMLLLEEGKAKTNDIKLVVADISIECQPILSARIRHEIMTTARPLKAGDLEDLAKPFKDINNEDCRTMQEQMNGA